MSNTKDIYYEGRIYQGVVNPLSRNKSWVSQSYIELTGTHPFTDGQSLVLNKDYEVRYQWYSHTADAWYDCSKENYDGVAQESARRQVAIPIEPLKEETAAKEKAKELVNRYELMILKQSPYMKRKNAHKQAKIYSLICVDEILNLDPKIDLMAEKYWQSVKTEITNL